MNKITKQSIISAHNRIQNYIHRTPILSSKTIARLSGCSQFYVKCQNFQKIGAFKPRGAFNKILQLGKVSSVCTHSSGNHAQALAYAASILKIPAYIVMPKNSPRIKIQAVKEYGGNVIESGNTLKQRQQALKLVAEKYNSTQVHAYNDIAIIEGQATTAKEIFEDLKDLDYILSPLGGGGLSSGSVLSTHFFGGKCKYIAAQPFLARDGRQSLIKGEIQPQMPPITISDGLRTSLGSEPFSILNHFLKPDDIILIEQKETIEAMKLVFERMKLVIEPSSANVVAAVLKDERFRGKKVCCILSGGNVDMSAFFAYLNSTLKQ